jgi:nucleoside-diphosphate-sugar epimerase
MMDRVIYAYGIHEDLDYTLFRPFNWLGPKMDDVYAPKEGSSRAVIQFISNILYQRPIKLMDGGKQRRCFTYVEEGVDGLMRIIENKKGCATRQIFNLGNPKNDYSIKDVAHLLIKVMGEYPSHAHLAKVAKVEIVDAEKFFGEHYQDVSARVPSIKNAQKHLGWTPVVDLETALKKTLDYHLLENPQEIKLSSTN